MPRPSEKLTDEARTFVVQRLAMYDPPELVARAVKDEFGITISRQGVHCYDPTKHAGRQLAKKWRDLFEATRKALVDGTAEVGVTHKLVRVRRLERMADRAEAVGNMALAKDLLKQVAEEMGNAYTNRRELTGPNGKELPAPQAAVTIYQLPDNGRG